MRHLHISPPNNTGLQLSAPIKEYSVFNIKPSSQDLAMHCLGLEGFLQVNKSSKTKLTKLEAVTSL